MAVLMTPRCWYPSRPYLDINAGLSYSNEVSEIDILYSANAKKEPAALLPKITDKTATPTDSTISIAQLLDSVNDYFPDILPERVLRKVTKNSRRLLKNYGYSYIIYIELLYLSERSGA